MCLVQASAQSKTVQPADPSGFCMPAEHDCKDLTRLLVTAEACLAAVVQADATVMPKKQKKAAAEVITGNLMVGTFSYILCYDTS